MGYEMVGLAYKLATVVQPRAEILNLKMSEIRH
jgi:hypothetical protein